LAAQFAERNGCSGFGPGLLPTSPRGVSGRGRRTDSVVHRPARRRSAAAPARFATTRRGAARHFGRWNS